MRKLVSIATLLVLVAATAVGAEAMRKAPLFMLEDVNGNQVKLSTFIGDKVVVLDFWAVGCAPCLTVMPHMEDMWQTYKGQGLVVIGISEDLPRNVSSVKAKAREVGVTYTIVLDKNAAALTAYQGGDAGIPFIVVIDLSGNIYQTFRRIQPGDEDKIETAIREALGLE
ncbi:MAG TPA: TlpA disulfide reductase family protein [bacterium]|nr:TlpA disulfide reductase family protein [bacterium]